MTEDACPSSVATSVATRVATAVADWFATNYIALLKYLPYPFAFFDPFSELLRWHGAREGQRRSNRWRRRNTPTVCPPAHPHSRTLRKKQLRRMKYSRSTH